MMPVVLIRGIGDVGSAVAHVLFTFGYPVVLHDSSRPSATRRNMAFCDAIFDGSAELEGVRAKRCDNMADLTAHLTAQELIPVTAMDFTGLMAALKPEVLVDARMRKHEQPEIQIGLAPFAVGLGPNFTAGETVHAAIETGWNEALGQVVWSGATRPLEGEPQTIAGHARDRYVYAPAAGLFRTSLQIGDMVVAGQAVARVEDAVLRAPIDGVLRGLTHDGVPVGRKAKVIEVDPRGAQAPVRGIAERPGRIARGVLEAIRAWQEMRTES